MGSPMNPCLLWKGLGHCLSWDPCRLSRALLLLLLPLWRGLLLLLPLWRGLLLLPLWRGHSERRGLAQPAMNPWPRLRIDLDRLPIHLDRLPIPLDRLQPAFPWPLPQRNPWPPLQPALALLLCFLLRPLLPIRTSLRPWTEPPAWSRDPCPPRQCPPPTRQCPLRLPPPNAGVSIPSRVSPDEPAVPSLPTRQCPE